MTSTLKTIFGEFETQKDNIVSRELGGPGHSCRRTFQLVNGETNELLGGVDIQGRSERDIKTNVLGLLRSQGFQKIEPAPAAA